MPPTPTPPRQLLREIHVRYQNRQLALPLDLLGEIINAIGVGTEDATTQLLLEIAGITHQLRDMADRIRVDQSLPTPSRAVDVTYEFNQMRKALVALDQALHARHNQRHPIKRLQCTCIGDVHSTMCEAGLGPTQPLDAQTRADIDSTP